MRYPYRHDPPPKATGGVRSPLPGKRPSHWEVSLARAFAGYETVHLIPRSAAHSTGAISICSRPKVEFHIKGNGKALLVDPAAQPLLATRVSFRPGTTSLLRSLTLPARNTPFYEYLPLWEVHRKFPAMFQIGSSRLIMRLTFPAIFRQPCSRRRSRSADRWVFRRPTCRSTSRKNSRSFHERRPEPSRPS